MDGGKKKTEGWGIEGGDKDGLGGGGWSLADDGINGGIGDGCMWPCWLEEWGWMVTWVERWSWLPGYMQG